MINQDDSLAGSNSAVPTVSMENPSVFGIIRSKFWHFIILGFIAGICGVIFAYNQERRYESHLSFSLNEGGNVMGSLTSLASEMGINIGGGNETIFGGDNIMEILKSRRIVETVLLSTDTVKGKVFTLAERYLDVSGLRKSEKIFSDVHFPAGLSRTGFNYLQDSVLYELSKTLIKDDIKVSRPDRRMSIFQINVTTNDERLTKVITHRLLHEAKLFYTDVRTRKAKNTMDILEGRFREMKEKFNLSLEETVYSKDANLNPAFGETQLPVLKSQSDMQVYLAAYSEFFKNLEIARFQYLNEIPVLEVIDEANYPMKLIKASKILYGLLFAVISSLLLLIFYWLRLLTRINREKQ